LSAALVLMEHLKSQIEELIETRKNWKR